MFTRLYDKFPNKIHEISKTDYPPNLAIRCEYVKINEEDDYLHGISILIESANPNDRDEPYTQETLDKAIKEFPEKYEEEIKRYDKK